MPFIQDSTFDHNTLGGMLTKLQALANHFIHQVWHILLSSSPHTLMDVGTKCATRIEPIRY
jgi:hypothetical protein